MVYSGDSADAVCVQGILNEVWKHKLIFVETPDAAETSIALDNYRKVGCSSSLCLYQKLRPIIGM